MSGGGLDFEGSANQVIIIFCQTKNDDNHSNIRDCESLCLSDETVKAVGPFYLVSMPGEVKDPT